LVKDRYLGHIENLDSVVLQLASDQHEVFVSADFMPQRVGSCWSVGGSIDIRYDEDFWRSTYRNPSWSMRPVGRISIRAVPSNMPLAIKVSTLQNEF
jgi:hypothetical protein